MLLYSFFGISASTARRSGAMKIVCYIYIYIYIASDRSAKFLVGNGRPVKFFRRQDVNAIQRGVVYILRNAYEIALCSTYRKNAEIAVCGVAFSASLVTSREDTIMPRNLFLKFHV